MTSINGKQRLRPEAEFLTVIDKINASALDAALWPDTLDAVANLLGAVSVTAELIDLKQGRPVYIEFGERLSAEVQDRYTDDYSRINPRIADGMGQPAGAIRYDYAFLSEKEIGLDPFYSDFVAPLDLKYFISGHILGTLTHAGIFAAQRSPSQGHAGDEEIDLVRRLIPHMRHAFDTRARLAGTDLHHRGGLHGGSDLSEAMLLVDRDGRVLQENSAAADLLSAHDGVTAASRMLDFSDPAAAAKFAGALAGLDLRQGQEIDMEARGFAARRPSGGRPYIVAVRALPAADAFADALLGARAMVFIRDPQSYSTLDEVLLKESYGLSQAETDLAVALDLGRTLADIAADRGVSITTVRTQLYALMAKLDVNRQTDLVRLLRQYRQPF